MRRLSGQLLLCLMGAHCLYAPDAAAAQPYTPDAVKAAYLYRFTDYISWPDQAASQGSFDIAIVDAPGVARELRRVLAAHAVKNQPGQVREVAAAEDLGAARIVYIGAGHADFLRRAVAANSRRPILWVTEEEGDLDYGSVVNFLSVDHRVRFEVSLSAADRCQLSISSELLAVAARVNGERQRGRRS